MRFLAIKVFFLLFFTAISLRLFYWQVVKADELSVQAENQHFTNSTLTGTRGQIFFSDGSLLASVNPIFSVFAQPKVVKQDKKGEIAYSLAKTIWDFEHQDLDIEKKTRLAQIDELKNEIYKTLGQDLYWVPIKPNINIDLKKEIEDLKIEGIGFEQSNGRFYPEGSSAAHLAGFVGSNSRGENTGYFGIEGYYEGELKGISGKLRHEKDAFGLPILTGEFFTTEAVNGKDIVLNIDRTVQFIVENALKKGIVKYGAKSASVVVMDPQTGGILAMASYPNYDPYEYFKYPKEFYRNPIVADQYEPGSTFKVLTMAAAVNEDLVKSDTKCDICDKPVQMGGFTIKTWNNKYQADATMKDVIVHSDNTGMVFVGKKLGLDTFYRYIEDFGFGKATDIDLQDESSPNIRPKDEWREIDVATASFGQGIAVTPIQMVRAVSVIANGGKLMEPRVAREIVEGDKKYEVEPMVIKEVIKPETAKVITEIMVAAVQEGEAKAYVPKGYKIAGKTGTAQIPVAGHYDPNKTIASFVGFAPADNPKFVMLVRYDQPTSSIYGSETAAPTFFEIAKQLFPYFKIAPSE